MLTGRISTVHNNEIENQNSHSSTGVLIGIGSAESVGGTWVRSTCGAPVRGGLGDEAEVGSRRG
jgi:hypothetical protein